MIAAHVSNEGILKEPHTLRRFNLLCLKGPSRESIPDPIFVRFSVPAFSREELAQSHTVEVTYAVSVVHGRKFIVTVHDAGFKNCCERVF
jgi:hypothetical protein